MMRAETRMMIAYAKEGMAPRDIAHKVDVDQSAVYSALRYARSKGEDIPYFSTRPAEKSAGAKAAPTVAEIVVPLRLHSLLAREAAKRGTTERELAQRILETALLGSVPT